MDNKNIEMMKKIIQDKKNKNSAKVGDLKPERVIGGWKKGRRSNKSGGVFDK